SLMGSETFENNTYWSNRASSSWFGIGSTSYSLAGWVTATGETGAQSSQVSFPEPSRTMASYNAAQGGTASLEAFLAEARMQSKSYWRAEYTAPAANDYVRA